jgi:hypothetical protein
MMARQAGMQFQEAATNGMAQGKSFAEIAADKKLTVVELPPFSIMSTSAPPQLDVNVPLDFLKEVSFMTPPGKVSEFRSIRFGGIVVHVKSVLPIDDAKMKADLPGFISYVRQSRQREAFDAWFRKELSKGITSAPLLEQQQKASAARAGG